MFGIGKDDFVFHCLLNQGDEEPAPTSSRLWVNSRPEPSFLRPTPSPSHGLRMTNWCSGYSWGSAASTSTMRWKLWRLEVVLPSSLSLTHTLILCLLIIYISVGLVVFIPVKLFCLFYFSVPISLIFFCLPLSSAYFSLHSAFFPLYTAAGPK